MSLTLATPQEMTPTPATAERVLYVFDGEFALDNGVSSYIRTIGDYAMQEGCEVEYLVGKTAIDEPNVSAFSKNVSLHANGSRSFIPIHTPKARITDVLERFDPEAVHVQLPFLPSLSGKVIKQLKPRTNLIGTFHTPMPQGWLRTANRLNARVSKDEMRRFDHFFSVSESAQAAAKEIYGVDSEVLPCPIDVSQAYEKISPSTSGDIVITFLGRLVARKGLATLLDSVDLLQPEVRGKLQLQIIGEGVDREALERQVSNSGLQGITQFFGKVDEEKKYELLSSSDIVTYPSTGGESFGIVLVEAMATGKPVVVASNIEGYAEVLSDVPDALVAKNDPQALADKIAAIIDSPDQKQALFHKQQQVVKRFDITRAIGPRLIQAYGTAKG
jgi:phosphatidylinositol alpha-mannosyltransferase